MVKKHGGQFLVRTDKITPLRAAEPAIKRYVIIGFDNAQQAKAWYDSADMKDINTYNDQHTKGRAFLVEWRSYRSSRKGRVAVIATPGNVPTLAVGRRTSRDFPSPIFPHRKIP